MRVVIDLQGAQTESRFRGIGRFSLSLALAMARNARDHELWLALNGAFPDSILDIRHTFDGLIPQQRIRVFDVPGAVAEHDPLNSWRARAAEKIREHFLQALQPEVVLVTSLFEGYVDDAVTSIGAFSSGLTTAAVLYDLIPLLHPETYLPADIQRNHYFRKIQSLKNAQVLLAISESSRREGIEALQVPEERVVTISAGLDSRFRALALTQEEKERVRERYRIQRKFVLYAPGGFDPRKNIDGLIRAYALLPSDVRARHQLVIVSRISAGEQANIQYLRKQENLADDELVLAGYASEEDLVLLYNLATLFVLPSKHEGFGLPALEAMACGAATIGSATTSVPEVIGWDEALFDPYSDASMAAKMAQALVDDVFRERLRQHGLKQSQRFSWEASAARTIEAMAAVYTGACAGTRSTAPANGRPKLAYISPLPPERSGISDYSAKLLPELARYYDIDVIGTRRQISDPWIQANWPGRDVAWFKKNASRYSRVLYHFGNSPFHTHMFGLLRQYPGVVVLHDFFLSSVLAHEEITGGMPGALLDALYHSHGYRALIDRYSNEGLQKATERYPSNLEVLQSACGVIVHSEYSRTLTRAWYGEAAGSDWAVIPLLRHTWIKKGRDASRKSLGIADDAFVVCTFGFLDPTKNNHRLLAAWLDSGLGPDDKCLLVFVGENHGGDYGRQLLETIARSGLKHRIRITGWADTATFHDYLTAADIGVQLRTLSRGESSAAVLDCMNHGLPTIVNACGSMAELPEEAVWKLPDSFTNAELQQALEALWRDGERRSQLAAGARAMILSRHHPATCAEQYREAIETFYQRAAAGRHALVASLAALGQPPGDDGAFACLAKSIAACARSEPALRQVLVDVSSIARNDLRTGIERVVRAQVSELIRNPPEGFRIEPVYASSEGGQWHYRYARSYTCRLLGIEQAQLRDEPIDIFPGDIFYAPDFAPNLTIAVARAGLFKIWQAANISLNFLIHDLLPILRPEFFPEGAGINHEEWLRTVAECSSRLICISHAVADEVRGWLETNPPTRLMPPVIDVVYHGADIAASVPVLGLPPDASELLRGISARPTFLMVGTIEPRKGYLQALSAFEELWGEGQNVNLVIVGKEGWTDLEDRSRRTIPEIVARLRNHPERGNRLFWLEGISDEYLEQVYGVARCLIAASYGEGFGLPLIEGARHGLPIIARDIPVFRETAGEHAYFFSAETSQQLANVIRDWMDQWHHGTAPGSGGINHVTWAESAKQLTKQLLDERSTGQEGLIV